MNPLTQIAAAAMLPSLANGVSEAASGLGNSFLEVFAATSPDSLTTQPDSQTGSDDARRDPSPVSSVLDSITERVRELLGNAKQDLGNTLHLDISPLGQLYVLNDHPDAQSIQMTLDDDPKLKDQIRQWLNEGGSDSLIIPVRS